MFFICGRKSPRPDFLLVHNLEGLLDPDPDPLGRGMDPDPSIMKQK